MGRQNASRPGECEERDGHLWKAWFRVVTRRTNASAEGEQLAWREGNNLAGRKRLPNVRAEPEGLPIPFVRDAGTILRGHLTVACGQSEQAHGLEEVKFVRR